MASDPTGAAQSTPPVSAADPRVRARAGSAAPAAAAFAAGALAAGALAASRALRARRRPRRRHPGRVRHDPRARGGAPQLALARARAAGHHRSGPNRDGRRQRRRRRRHLLPGGTELRDHPAVGAPAADPGADRQPGDGRTPRSRHRRRTRPADQGALRALLGLVLGDRPVHPELPHHRDRVHRRQPRARLLRRLRVHRGAARGGRTDRGDRERQLPGVGALDVRVRVRATCS